MDDVTKNATDKDGLTHCIEHDSIASCDGYHGVSRRLAASTALAVSYIGLPY